MTYFLTRHASARAKQMDLTPDEIAELLSHPHVTRECESRSQPGHWIWQIRRGALTAFADKNDDGDWMVLTFVPATEEEWRKRYPNPRDGRAYRPELWQAAR